MKKKGFTLIELLAVIVILAIIALIATPIVMNIIEDSKKGATARSADNYVKAVDLIIATKELKGTPIADGKYTIDTNGNLKKDGKEYEVEVSGTKPVGGKIIIEGGQVVKKSSAIKFKEHTVTFKDGVAEAKEASKLMTLIDCDYVSGTENTVGAKYTCDLGDGERTFYVLEAGTSSKPATLILEGNYDTETLAWCDQSGKNPANNVCGADGLNAKLDDIVNTAWIKLDRSQIGIPSVEKIMVADGREEDAYLKYPSLTKKWLYSYPGYAEWSQGQYGYWTSTPTAGRSNSAWVVLSSSKVGFSNVVNNGLYGVRPVITLSI